MKSKIFIHLLIFISLTLIILSQDFDQWSTFSTFKQWMTSIMIGLSGVNLIILFIISYRSIKSK